MAEPKFKKFMLPEKLTNQLYELTGSKNAYKVYIIAYCGEDGTPVIYSSCDTQITEAGLMRCLEGYIAEQVGNGMEVEPED